MSRVLASLVVLTALVTVAAGCGGGGGDGASTSTRRAWWQWRRQRTSRPARGGSQFFVVTGDDVGLPPDDAIVGTVTSGLDVVERIGQLGDAMEQPTEPVVVSDVVVTVGS